MKKKLSVFIAREVVAKAAVVVTSVIIDAVISSEPVRNIKNSLKKKIEKKLIKKKRKEEGIIEIDDSDYTVVEEA